MHYSLFNLTFDSQFPLVNLPLVPKSNKQCIAIDSVDTLDIDMASMQQVGAYCWVSPSDFLLKVPRLAEFHVHAGQSIKVVVSDGADLGLLKVYLQGYMFAILLQQRGHLVLHGTVLQKEGSAIAICGVSGIGKSTLAAMLMQQGWTLVSDDLCVFDADGQVMQGGNDLKIWPDVADLLSWTDTLPFADKLEKLQFTTTLSTSSSEPNSSGSFPLAAIYCLDEAQTDDTIHEYKGMHKFAPLKSNSYRTQFMTAMEQDGVFMQRCGAFLGNTPVYSLSRAKGKLSLDKLDRLASMVTQSLAVYG